MRMADIRKLARRIVREFNPERVVLFGSFAEGTATADSDVDLLVVLSFRGTPLVARRPEDVRRRYTEGDPLIREALDRGKVLYEQNR